eukprot:TRINITY_DN2104_c0_g2_i1.p1 TRINITY_DN2104_c0_g2~~TRINITY_DN2104_c0_g2_i1.p1  ORF type:complete len:770 (-),score=68.39 TRINITY_DN2104_c0_g2_i1:719-3028(-)
MNELCGVRRAAFHAPPVEGDNTYLLRVCEFPVLYTAEYVWIVKIGMDFFHDNDPFLNLNGWNSYVMDMHSNNPHPPVHEYQNVADLRAAVLSAHVEGEHIDRFSMIISLPTAPPPRACEPCQLCVHDGPVQPTVSGSETMGVSGSGLNHGPCIDPSASLSSPPASRSLFESPPPRSLSHMRFESESPLRSLNPKCLVSNLGSGCAAPSQPSLCAMPRSFVESMALSESDGGQGQGFSAPFSEPSSDSSDDVDNIPSNSEAEDDFDDLHWADTAIDGGSDDEDADVLGGVNCQQSGEPSNSSAGVSLVVAPSPCSHVMHSLPVESDPFVQSPCGQQSVGESVQEAVRSSYLGSEAPLSAAFECSQGGSEGAQQTSNAFETESALGPDPKAALRLRRRRERDNARKAGMRCIRGLMTKDNFILGEYMLWGVASSQNTFKLLRSMTMLQEKKEFLVRPCFFESADEGGEVGVSELLCVRVVPTDWSSTSLGLFARGSHRVHDSQSDSPQISSMLAAWTSELERLLYSLSFPRPNRIVWVKYSTFGNSFLLIFDTPAVAASVRFRGVSLCGVEVRAHGVKNRRLMKLLARGIHVPRLPTVGVLKDNVRQKTEAYVGLWVDPVAPPQYLADNGALIPKEWTLRISCVPSTVSADGLRSLLDSHCMVAPTDVLLDLSVKQPREGAPDASTKKWLVTFPSGGGGDACRDACERLRGVRIGETTLRVRRLQEPSAGGRFTHPVLFIDSLMASAADSHQLAGPGLYEGVVVAHSTALP